MNLVLCLLILIAPGHFADEPPPLPLNPSVSYWPTPTPHAPGAPSVDFEIAPLPLDGVGSFPYEMVGAYNRIDSSNSIFPTLQTLVVMMLVIAGGLSIMRQIRNL